jgi:hypothetical protein
LSGTLMAHWPPFIAADFIVADMGRNDSAGARACPAFHYFGLPATLSLPRA